MINLEWIKEPDGFGCYESRSFVVVAIYYRFVIYPTRGRYRLVLTIDDTYNLTPEKLLFDSVQEAKDHAILLLHRFEKVMSEVPK